MAREDAGVCVNPNLGVAWVTSPVVTRGHKAVLNGRHGPDYASGIPDRASAAYGETVQQLVLRNPETSMSR